MNRMRHFKNSNQAKIEFPIPDAGAAEKIKGVTGVILAGGVSSRMGSNKALLPQQGVRFIEVIYRTLAEMFQEVIAVTNTPEQYAFLPCRKVPDLHQGKGVLAGIHSGLKHSSEPAIFVVACDMPHLNPMLIRHLASLACDVDVVLPSTDKGFEPLHALYGAGCLPVLEEFLQSPTIGRVMGFLPKVRVREVLPEEIAPLDPGFNSFVNINTPEDYYRLRSGKREAAGTEDQVAGNEPKAPTKGQGSAAVVLNWQGSKKPRS
jgi:molybdopterin-guanine dinucleotide biosynthesis protein A